MNKYSKALLADAKKEYTNQLVSILTSPVYEGINSIYEGAIDISKNNTNGRNYLKTFQILLSQTPGWEQEKLDTEYARIKKNTECDYIEDLITAVFVAHTKILSSIKSSSQQKSIDLNIPTGSHFIHKVYIECARNFWKQPYLFNHKYSPLDLQRNLNKCEKIIKESILETIRKLLPVKDVLKEYLGSNFDEDSYSINHDDDVTSIVSENTKDNIRKLLKYEMDNTLLTNKDEKFSKISINDGADIHDIDSNMLVDNNTKVLNDEKIQLTIESNTEKDIEKDIEKTISEMKKSLTDSRSIQSSISNKISQNEDNNLEDNIENIKVDNKQNNIENQNSDVKSDALHDIQSVQTKTSKLELNEETVINNENKSDLTNILENNSSENTDTSKNTDRETVNLKNNLNVNDTQNLENKTDNLNIDIEALADTNSNIEKQITDEIQVKQENIDQESNLQLKKQEDIVSVTVSNINESNNDNETILNKDIRSLQDNESINKLINKYDSMTLNLKDKTLNETRSVLSKLSKKVVQQDIDKMSQQTEYNINTTLSPENFDNISRSEIIQKTLTNNDVRSVKSIFSRKTEEDNVPEDFSFFKDAAEF